MEWLTLSDAARRMGVSRQAVHQLYQRGTLPGGRRNGRVWFRITDVEELRLSPAFRLRSRSLAGASRIEVEHEQRASEE